MTIKVCIGKYIGLVLLYTAKDTHDQYFAKIWRDFKGITFYCVPNSTESKEQVFISRGHYAGMDYATAFTLLRAHFGLEVA